MHQHSTLSSNIIYSINLSMIDNPCERAKGEILQQRLVWLLFLQSAVIVIDIM